MNFLLWLLPDTFVAFVVHAIVLIGFIGYFLADFVGRFLPMLSTSQLKILFVILFSLGLYFEGSLAATKDWRDKVELMEQKVKVAEEKSKVENVRIVTKYKTKTTVIEKKGKDIVQYIDREITKYDDSCVIPKEFIEIHNKAAEEVK
jgi:hypothetical protein